MGGRPARDATGVLHALLGVQRRQGGVVARFQVLAAGGDDVVIARLLRQRRWAVVHEGVYVDHTGSPTWQQRAWAATLVHHPAALDGAAALRAAGVLTEAPARHEPVDVVVSRGRRVVDPLGVRTRQLGDFDDVARLHLSPPRVQVEHAVLTVAGAAVGEDAAVAAVADAVRAGATSPERLRRHVTTRTRLRHRGLLGQVLADVEEGAQSPLERRYLRDVERAHGLPRGRRQVRDAVVVVPGEPALRVVYRDVEYEAHATLVELDGALGHSAAVDRWADLDRDLAAAVAGRVTLRAGWAQVLAPCRLAAVVAGVLSRRGWTGRPTACPACSSALGQVRIA